MALITGWRTLSLGKCAQPATPTSRLVQANPRGGELEREQKASEKSVRRSGLSPPSTKVSPPAPGSVPGTKDRSIRDSVSSWGRAQWRGSDVPTRDWCTQNRTRMIRAWTANRETVTLPRGGVRRAFLEDSGLGLFGCVGVHRLKELAGQREKCKQRQGDRRGLVGQRSEFSRPLSQERTRSLKEKSDLHMNPTPGPLHLLCPLPKVLFTQIFAQLLLLIVHLLRGFP